MIKVKKLVLNYPSGKCFVTQVATFIFWSWAGILKRIQKPYHIILLMKFYWKSYQK